MALGNFLFIHKYIPYHISWQSLLFAVLPICLGGRYDGLHQLIVIDAFKSRLKLFFQYYQATQAMLEVLGKFVRLLQLMHQSVLVAREAAGMSGVYR